MISRVLAIYIFAVAIALALLVISLAVFAFLFAPFLILTAAEVIVAGILTAAFVYDYINYAVVEFGDFAPQSWQYSILFILSYVMMFFALAAGSEGLPNFLAYISLFLAAAVVLYTSRNIPLRITSGDIIGDIRAGTSTFTLGLAVGIPIGFIFLVPYEAHRMWKRGARIAAASALLSLLFAIFMPSMDILSSLMSINLIQSMSFLPLGHNVFTGQYGLVDILTWPGRVGYEELISRFALDAVGPLANYMFVVLHAPSRLIEALAAAPAVLTIISMGTRWITDVYRNHGLVGSITAHAVYNTMVAWLLGTLLFPLLWIPLLLILIYAYITRPKP
jgi:hypothetical protein